MTVAELIADLIAELSKFDQDAEVGFAISPNDDLEIVRVYTDKNGKVWLDLEDRA